jgi:hypothetical protein
MIAAGVCQFVTGDLSGFFGLVNVSDKDLVANTSVRARLSYDRSRIALLSIVAEDKAGKFVDFIVTSSTG